MSSRSSPGVGRQISPCRQLETITQFALASADYRISAPVALNPTAVSASPSAQLSAPEGMCVNLLRFKRKNGLSNQRKETTASENVIARAHSQKSVQLCALWYRVRRWCESCRPRK